METDSIEQYQSKFSQQSDKKDKFIIRGETFNIGNKGRLEKISFTKDDREGRIVKKEQMGR